MVQGRIARLSQWAAAGIALSIATPLFAQEAAQAPAPADQQRAGVEEIIVTATKREANIQDIPIAVSAFQGDELTQRGVDEIEDLAQVSPSINVNTSNTASGGGTLRIRGVGTTGNNIGLESAVGTFIDGVYRSRSGQGFSDLLDIERIEVLRGPQGTLFGKNTSAGAVNIITKRPNLEEGEGFAQVELGNYDHKRIALSYSAPIIDEILAFRVAAAWNDKDGFYEDANGSDAWGGRDRYMIRGQLLWAPIENFDARLIADYGERDESCCPGVYAVGSGATVNAARLLAGPGVGAPFNYPGLGLGNEFPTVVGENISSKKRHVGVNYEPFEEIVDWGIQLELNWDLEWATLTSITAYRSFDAHYAEDIDFSSADILRPQNPDSGGAHDEFLNFSEEIRASGSWEKFDWLVGLYAYTEEIDVYTRIEAATQEGQYLSMLFAAPALEPFFPAGNGYDRDGAIDTSGWAIFTNNTYHLLDSLDLTVGARYGQETKDGGAIVNDASPGTIANDPVPSIGTLPWCNQLPVSLGATGAFIRTAVLQGSCDNFSWSRKEVEKEWTYTASLTYHINDDIHAYFSYSRGYKAGGFNTDQDAFDLTSPPSNPIVFDPVTGDALPGTGVAVDNSHFDPEFSDSFEVGIKGTYLDGMVRANVTYFHTEFEDFQLNTFTGLGFIVSNADKVIAQGGELEMFMFPADGIQLTFGVTYSDARYGDNVGLCFPYQYPTGQANRCSPIADTGTDPDTGLPFTEDFFIDGKRITNAPAWTGAASFYGEHVLPSTEWMGFASVNTAYRGRHNTGSNLHADKFEDAHWFLNMSLGVRSPDEHWEFSIWSQNLTDEMDRSIVFDTVFQAGSFSYFANPPRTYGGTAKYVF